MRRLYTSQSVECVTMKRTRFPRWRCRFCPYVLMTHTHILSSFTFCFLYMLFVHNCFTLAPADVVVVARFWRTLQQLAYTFLLLRSQSHGRSLLAIDIRLLSKMYINFNLKNNRSLSSSTLVHHTHSHTWNRQKLLDHGHAPVVTVMWTSPSSLWWTLSLFIRISAIDGDIIICYFRDGMERVSQHSMMDCRLIVADDDATNRNWNIIQHWQLTLMKTGTNCIVSA